MTFNLSTGVSTYINILSTPYLSYITVLAFVYKQSSYEELRGYELSSIIKFLFISFQPLENRNIFSSLHFLHSHFFCISFVFPACFFFCVVLRTTIICSIVSFVFFSSVSAQISFLRFLLCLCCDPHQHPLFGSNKLSLASISHPISLLGS